jgi:hypothetical protein
MPSAISRFAAYVQSRRNFVTFVTVFAGSLSALGYLWRFGDGDIAWGLFLILLAVLGALLSGLLLWEVFGMLYPRGGDNE